MILKVNSQDHGFDQEDLDLFIQHEDRKNKSPPARHVSDRCTSPREEMVEVW